MEYLALLLPACLCWRARHLLAATTVAAPAVFKKVRRDVDAESLRGWEVAMGLLAEKRRWEESATPR